MKILFIAAKYDYGNPGRGLSYEYYNFYDTLTKMQNGSHSVTLFPFDEVLRTIGRDGMNQKLLETVSLEKPDLCFFFLVSDEIKTETIKEITRQNRAVTLNWFADDHWRFDNFSFSRYYAPLFHWVATTDSAAPAKYERMGYRNAIKTQWACNHFMYKKPDIIGQPHEITFVGQPNRYRVRAVNALRDANIKIECWGRRWPAGRITQEEMMRVFAASKINLNLTSITSPWTIKSLAKIFINRWVDDSYHLRSLLTWPANIKSWWNQRRLMIKGRNFEIPGCGGFLLTEDADNLGDYYQGGKEIAIFRGLDDLIDKTRYYLAHDEERKRIAIAGYERTLRDHTYERRFQEIFKTIGLV